MAIYHKLAINADDYGPVPFMNAGIIDAVNQGLVTSVSVLANNYEAPGYQYEFKKAMKDLITACKKNKAGIGVHLCITAGGPLTKSDHLVLTDHNTPKPGEFHEIQDLRLSLDDKHLKAIKAEIKAQIKRVNDELKKNGMKLDHVNSHHNIISLFDPYHTCLMHVLKEMKIKTAVRNPLPISKDDLHKKKYKSNKRQFKDSVMKKKGTWTGALVAAENNEPIKLLMTIASNILEKNMKIRRTEAIFDYGHVCPDFLFDGFYGQPEDEYEVLKNMVEFYKKHKKRNISGELVVHLGKGKHSNQAELNGIESSYFDGRQKEREELEDYGLPEKLKAAGIKLCRMSDL